VTVRPHTLFDRTFTLDENSRHRWSPISPFARVEVEMNYPGLSWSGDGYFDHNHGDEPLEEGFVRWDWSRAHRGPDTLIRYEALTRSGHECDLNLRLAAGGAVEPIGSAPMAPLTSTPIWRMPRRTRAQEPSRARVKKTFEDTPFYARSLIETTHDGQQLQGFHESLDLDRFSRTVVQGMLPFRMPRTG
jgi:carotenoid 1,2-hydratase